MTNMLKNLMKDFGYLAEDDARNLELSVKDQISRAAVKDEIDTIAFGLETDDGQIVKVYVNAEHAEKFEKEMAEMLGEVDDIEEALNQISKDIEIVDVEWPEEDEGDEATDVDAEATDETDGSEVLDAKVYSKENKKKEGVAEMSYGDELTASLLEDGQNSIANQLSTVNQHLIYQAILHLGVPELALDKSPYRSSILRGIKDTALELAHSPSMRNTLKIFIKQQAMDDMKTADDVKHRGDAAKHHKGDTYDKGMQAAGVVKHNDKKSEVTESIDDPSGAAAFWQAVTSLAKVLDSTPGKEHVARLLDNQNYKSLVARSATRIVGRMTSGIRTKLKALETALSSLGLDEQFNAVDAGEMLKTMLMMADDAKQTLATRVIESQAFKRLLMSGKTSVPSLNTAVKKALSNLKVELDKVSLREADEPMSFSDDEQPPPKPKAKETEPAEEADAEEEVSEPAPEKTQVEPPLDATDSGVSFKAEGDSVTITYQGGTIELGGESLERALKALSNKQTLSVQLANGKFAVFSPRGSSGVIKLMGTEVKVNLTPTDIAAFLDAGDQALEGGDADNAVKEAKKISFEEMLKQYQQWLQNPVGKQADFFKKFGWSRASFFEEASNRGIDA